MGRPPPHPLCEWRFPTCGSYGTGTSEQGDQIQCGFQTVGSTWGERPSVRGPGGNSTGSCSAVVAGPCLASANKSSPNAETRARTECISPRGSELIGRLDSVGDPLPLPLVLPTPTRGSVLQDCGRRHQLYTPATGRGDRQRQRENTLPLRRPLGSEASPPLISR